MGFIDRLVVRDNRTEEVDAVQRRLEAIPSHELGMWLDNVLSVTGRSIQNYLKDKDQAELEEAKMGVRSLQGLIQELERRGP